jgi:hypothetical protein
MPRIVERTVQSWVGGGEVAGELVGLGDGGHAALDGRGPGAGLGEGGEVEGQRHGAGGQGGLPVVGAPLFEVAQVAAAGAQGVLGPGRADVLAGPLLEGADAGELTGGGAGDAGESIAHRARRGTPRSHFELRALPRWELVAGAALTSQKDES